VERRIKMLCKKICSKCKEAVGMLSSQVLKKKAIAILMIICLSAGVLIGCGDGITEETMATVNAKTDQTLQLYAEIEKMVADNGLVADQTFLDMKTQLTDMSGKIKSEIENTTEEDGLQTIKELDRILANLQEVKENVVQTIQK